MSLGLIPKIISFYDKLPEVEVIWVVGSSDDGTSEYLKKHQDNVIETQFNSRGARQNLGIRRAKSDLILLNHPRSLMEQGAVEMLLQNFQDNPMSWGGFTHAFIDNSHYLLQFTSFYSNRIRFDRNGIVYLDHCIFFNKKLLQEEVEYVPEVDIFEDTLLSEKLKKFEKPIRLEKMSYTSPVRFERNGVWRQAIMNQVLKLGYSMSISHKTMNKIYEKGLGLNSNYK